MFGFGFDGNKQLSSILKRQNVNSGVRFITEPKEICLINKLSSPEINNKQVQEGDMVEQLDTSQVHHVDKPEARDKTSNSQQIRSISIAWDSILFIYDDGRFHLSGFRSQNKKISTSLPPEALVSSGCLTWDSIYLISDKGICFTTDFSTDHSSQVMLAKDDTSLALDGAQCVSHVISGGKHCFALTDSQRVCHVEVHDDEPIFRPVSLHVAVKQISCGKEHTLMLSRIGSVFSCGIGGQGQLGHGDVEHRDQPIAIEALQGVSMVTIAAGGWHSAAVSDIGDLYIWGWNERGQLGFPSKTIESTCKGTNQPEPDEQREYVNILAQPAILDIVSGSEVNVSKVSCGSRHTAAITEDGELYTWGWNKYGQLGHADTRDRDTPCRVRYFVDNVLTVTDVYCGYWNTIVTTEPRVATGTP